MVCIIALCEQYLGKRKGTETAKKQLGLTKDSAGGSGSSSTSNYIENGTAISSQKGFGLQERGWTKQYLQCS